MPDASSSGRRDVYGSPAPVFGQVYGTLAVESVDQVRLLQSVLEDGMRKHAGKRQETYLARLYNELERMAQRSAKEKWTGWEKDSRP